MKKLLSMASALLFVFVASAADTEWLTDLAKAKELAKSDKKLILMDFTGSDWCGWCKKMDKDVFSTSEFSDYAKKSLVLLEVDFPRAKKISEAQKKANADLQKEYGVNGYPTFVVINAEGKQLAKMVGYQQGGPAKFIESLEKLKSK